MNSWGPAVISTSMIRPSRSRCLALMVVVSRMARAKSAWNFSVSGRSASALCAANSSAEYPYLAIAASLTARKRRVSASSTHIGWGFS